MSIEWRDVDGALLGTGVDGARAWTALCERAAAAGWDYRRVGLDVLGPDLELSTVALGLDHQFDADGPPLIFETMVFGGPMDAECWRYTTLEQAKAGHAHALALVRADHDATTPR